MRQGAAPEFAGADCGVAAGAGSAAGKGRLKAINKLNEVAVEIRSWRAVAFTFGSRIFIQKTRL
jgi:hypothetical protein